MQYAILTEVYEEILENVKINDRLLPKCRWLKQWARKLVVYLINLNNSSFRLKYLDFIWKNAEIFMIQENIKLNFLFRNIYRQSHLQIWRKFSWQKDVDNLTSIWF